MKKWKIKYQKGFDIRVMEIEALTKTDAQRQFYMLDVLRDIISIEEVTNETESQQS